MLIREPSAPDDGGTETRAREMKIRIPIAYHVRLHSLKILTGKPISEVVTEALDAYFAGPGAGALGNRPR